MTANTDIPIIQTVKSIPEIVVTARAPKYKIDVKFTATYNINQKTAMIKLTVGE